MDPAERLEQLERSLHDPAVRRDRGALDRLLDPRFREIGASGRIYDRASIIDELVARPGTGVRAWGFDCQRLRDGLYLLTYSSDDGVGRRTAARSSIWAAVDGGSFAIVFHQGTPIPEGGLEPPTSEEG